MIRVDTGLCDLCGTCISVCPHDAICLRDAVTVDKNRCVTCLVCVRVCPVGALSRSVESKPDGPAAVKGGRDE